MKYKNAAELPEIIPFLLLLFEIALDAAVVSFFHLRREIARGQFFLRAVVVQALAADPLPAARRIGTVALPAQVQLAVLARFDHDNSFLLLQIILPGNELDKIRRESFFSAKIGADVQRKKMLSTRRSTKKHFPFFHA